MVCSQDGPCCGGENQGTTPHLQGVHLIATSWLKDADTRAYVQCNSLHGKLKEEARSVSGVGVKLAQVRGVCDMRRQEGTWRVGDVPLLIRRCSHGCATL